MNREVVVNLFKKVARILEDDKQYEWLADEVKDYLNEIYVNEESEQEPKFNFDLERMKVAIESQISNVTVDDLVKQVKQEPVAWKVIDKTNGEYMFSRVKPIERSYKYDVVIPLYTAQPKREPLSFEEIVKLWANKSPTNEFECVRLVEKAHGIGGGE